MNYHRFASSLAIMVALVLLPDAAVGQQKSLKDQLVGTWTFISSTTKFPDGSPVWGSNPKGLIIFTESGHYSSHVLRSDRPKFASNSRATGTPEENKAAVLGGIALYGSYSVADKVINFKVEGSTYPNWTGTEQKRNNSAFTAEQFTWSLPASIGGTAEVTWKRVK